MTEIAPELAERFGDALVVASDGAWELTVPPEDVREALEFLGREAEPPWDYLIDMCGVDYGEEFEVVYHLSRMHKAQVVRVRTRVPRRGGAVPTVSDIWPGASWPERELMEMYGVTVEGHPDPRNLLLPEGWKGYPLRKDYEYPADHPWLSRDPLHEGPEEGAAAQPGEGEAGSAP